MHNLEACDSKNTGQVLNFIHSAGVTDGIIILPINSTYMLTYARSTQGSTIWLPLVIITTVISQIQNTIPHFSAYRAIWSGYYGTLRLAI